MNQRIWRNEAGNGLDAPEMLAEYEMLLYTLADEKSNYHFYQWWTLHATLTTDPTRHTHWHSSKTNIMIEAKNFLIGSKS